MRQIAGRGSLDTERHARDLLLSTVPRWRRENNRPMRRMRCRPGRKASWRSLVLGYVPDASSAQGLRKKAENTHTKHWTCGGVNGSWLSPHQDGPFSE